MTIEEKVLEIMREVFDMDEISTDASQKNCERWDSLHHLTLASELEDYLVIDDVPDVFHTGHVHINTYRRFKGIHLINSGTFQTQTEFQKIYNIEPTPAEVPILHKGKYKHFKFI